MSTQDELPFAAGLEVETPDQLYEIYRYGFITRHLCANGRVDDVTWLRELRPGDEPPLAAPSSLRQRPELVADPAADPRDMTWQPLARLPPAARQARLVSMGGGDNALLRGGLALATFALEARLGVSDVSHEYAKHVFAYLSDCEFRQTGFFLRKQSDMTRLKFASTDEMVGLCFGLLFYYKFLAETGSDPEQLERVVAMVTRIAHNMDAHGYWVLPYARDLETYGDLKAAFLDLEGVQDWGHQTAFVFAYPFRLMFERVAGVKTDPQWDPQEFSRYFTATPHLAWGNTVKDKVAIDFWTVAAAAVARSDPSLWDYLEASAVGAIVGGLLGAGLGAIIGAATAAAGLGVVDANLSVHEETFVINGCKAVTEIFAAPSGDPVDAALHPWRLLANKFKDKYFNFHMLALAGLMAAECGCSVEAWREFGDAMNTLLEDPDGKGNTLFAIIANRFGLNPTNRVWEALSVLDRAKPDANGLPVFQHDLPLNYLELVQKLASNDPEDRLCAGISAHLGQPQSEWRERIRASNPAFDLNPQRRWGSSASWEKEYDSRVAFEWSHEHFGARQNGPGSARENGPRGRSGFA